MSEHPKQCEQGEDPSWPLAEVLEELKTAEEDLRQQNITLEQERQKYQDLFNFAPDGYLVTDPLGVIQAANQASSHLLGIPQANLINNPLIVFIATQDCSLFYDQLDRQSSPVDVVSSLENRQQAWEITFQPRKKATFSAEVTVTPIYENADTITGLRWLIRDISHRKQAELERERAAQALDQLNQVLEQRVEERTAALQKSQDFIEQIAQASPNILYLYDIQTESNVYTNREISTVLGYTPAEIKAMGPSLFQNLIHPEDLSLITAEYARINAAQERDILEFEYRMKRANGEWCWLLSRHSIFSRDLQGRVQQTIGTAQDITERKAALLELQEYKQSLERANAKLLQATRLKDEFLATMSHELRTPLNAILGQSETLQEEIFGSLNERQHKSIATIERSGEKLLSLINDILEFSNIAAGNLDLELTTVAVEDLCNSSLELVKEQAFQQQIQLTITLAPNLGNIQVDECQIRRVLINLLNNAIKFTPAGGRVRLDVQLEAASSEPPDKDQDSLVVDKWLILSVTDTGIGISPANQSKLFQAFVQLDGDLNRQYEGAGLGLMLAKQLVELHGGAVSCASELGQGSCFTVRLPYCT